MPSLADQSTARSHYLELASARDVPDTHAWPKLDDHPCGTDSVPVINLSAPDAVQRVGRACQAWGVFHVVGHGVPDGLLDSVEAQARRLFSLPMTRKLRAARAAGSVSGYGHARISSFFSKLMWSEGFTIAGSPVDHARKIWPHHYTTFCDVIEEYKQEMKELAARLMRLMLLSLDLTEEDLNWAEPSGDFPAVLQLNWYPACPDPDRAMGLAAHTDSSLLTILHQSDVSGLQALRPADGASPARWVTVPPLPGALVVNVGDLAHILSNGRFHSVHHRAVVNRTRHRLSAAYICGPPADVKVSPVGKLVGPGRGPAYRAVTWAEYLGLKGKLFDEALASIKVPDETWEDHSNNKTSVVTCA